MGVAGIAWGFYSLRGRGAANALQATAGNFLYAVPLTLATSLAFAGDMRADAAGIGLALASGAFASAMGYAVWYAALRGLSATGAATVQLSAPVIAAFGGVLLLSEAVTPRLLIASAATLGGIALVILRRRRPDAPSTGAPQPPAGIR
jgi:drug/metabolite transporter (DMT)-like permease